MIFRILLKFLVVGFYFFFLQCSAQPVVSVHPQEILNESGVARWESEIGKVDSKFIVEKYFATESATGSIQLESYNESGAFQKRFIYKSKSAAKAGVGSCFIFQNQICLLTYNELKKESLAKIMVQEIASATMVAGKEIKEIAAVKIGMDWAPISITNVISKDGNKLLSLLYSKTADGRHVLHPIVFGPGYLMLWEKEFILPLKESAVKFEDCIIDDAGRVFISARKKSEENQMEYSVYCWDQVGSFRETNLEIKAQNVLAAKIAINVSGDLVAAGFTTPVRLKGIQGIFTAQFEYGTGAWKTVAQSEIRKNFSEVFKTSLVAKNENADYDFELFDVMFRPDGGMYLVAELSAGLPSPECFVIENPFLHGQCCSYFDAMIVSVSNELNIEGFNVIPKSQTIPLFGSTQEAIYSPIYGSVGLAIYGPILYVIYEDNPVNLNSSAPDNIKDFKLADVCVLATITPDGGMERVELIPGENNGQFSEFQLRPKSIHQHGSGNPILIQMEKTPKTFIEPEHTRTAVVQF